MPIGQAEAGWLLGARFMASLRRLLRTVTSLTQDTPPKVREISDGTPDLLVGTELAGVFVHSPTLRAGAVRARKVTPENHHGNLARNDHRWLSKLGIPCSADRCVWAVDLRRWVGDEADGLAL